jgi:hypothetical protein
MLAGIPWPSFLILSCRHVSSFSISIRATCALGYSVLRHEKMVKESPVRPPQSVKALGNAGAVLVQND